MSFDVQTFRKSFPQLERTMGPSKLVYLDSGASSLKHSQVTDRVNSYNRFESANVHRGAHQTSRQGTENYEGARQRIQKFINASSEKEVVWTRGTTEGVNFIASGLETYLQKGDEILITSFEHHSNIVPWQVLCEKTGAQLVVADFDAKNGLNLENFKSKISPKTKLASFIHYSNSFGNRMPVEEMVEVCKAQGVLTLVDSAQAVLTEKIDVQKIGCDFLVFSGHKMFGPYGIGVLYIRQDRFDLIPPYQTGGSMIDRVTFEKTTYAEPPQKYEAGTPNVAGAIGLGEAANLILNMGLAEAHQHVLDLRGQLLDGLRSRGFIEVYNFESRDYTGVVSFNVKGAHSSDVGTLLDKYGFAVRAGHHCTQPLMDLLGVPGTVRVSMAPYNTQKEIHDFLTTLDKVEEFF